MKSKETSDTSTPSPLPKPSVEVRMSGDTGPWSEEQVRAITTNPIYAGFGPFQRAERDDEAWVRAAAREIREQGPEQFLVNLLVCLRASFPDDGE